MTGTDCPCHQPGYDPDRYLDGNTDDAWEPE